MANARDLMISADEIVSVDRGRTIDYARHAGAGKAVTLVVDERENFVGVAGTRAIRYSRGTDMSLSALHDKLAPIAIIGLDTPVEEMGPALEKYGDVWHMVVAGGALVGAISPSRVAMAIGAETYGNIGHIWARCLCCQADPRHCFDGDDVVELGLSAKDPCPEDDKTPLVLSPCTRR